MVKLPLTAALLAAMMSMPALAQETRTFTDDLGRTVDIPSEPLRIVSLQDLAITVPLLELGVTPLAARAGRTARGYRPDPGARRQQARRPGHA